MNLNNLEWKPFLLASLYHIVMGDKLDKNKTNQDNPSINFVSRISYNNGVDAVVDEIDGLTPHPAGLLTVSLGGEYLGSCYIQKAPFYTAQNIAIMKPRSSEMTFEVNMFICSLVKYECKTKYYAFGRELNTHIRTDFEVSLPVKLDNTGIPVIDSEHTYSNNGYIPDWQFMKCYIKSLHYKPVTTNNQVFDLSLHPQFWREFAIPELFDVGVGKYYYPDQYNDGQIPYITASDTDNGVGAKINLSPDFSGGKITIGKIGATAYFQNQDFCATSDVNVLTPKSNMNKYHLLFITSVINFSENYKWSYGRQCRKGDTEGIVIKLPVKCNPNGTPLIDENKQFSDKGYIPDWNFMENYIKLLPYGDRI